MPRNSPDQPPPAEILSAIWFSLHSRERFGVSMNEVHYFRTLAVSLDDDLSSLLLLKKLKLADEYPELRMPRDIVTLNSFFEFSIEDGPRRFGQLAHPSSRLPSFAITADSRLGIGVLGLRSGQKILWPDEHRAIQSLEVLRVENCPGMSAWASRRSTAVTSIPRPE